MLTPRKRFDVLPSIECTSMTASLLLVDDDPQIVRALVPALEVSGLCVTVATNGRDALAQVEKQSWDALVVDLGLPDMDGKTVVRHLRHKSGTPAIVISAQHSRKVVEAARVSGATCFLQKPFRTPELIDCIHKAMSGEAQAW
jgi:two-component system KDP operon response regulator KdpE